MKHTERLLTVCALLAAQIIVAAQSATRTLSGVVVTAQNETAAGVTVAAQTSTGEARTETNERGEFRLNVPAGEAVTLKLFGKNIALASKIIGANESGENLQIRVSYVVPPIHESVVIEANSVDPAIDLRNDTIYKNTLFARDDQLIESLNAGINAGQHEGGGKSLEIRRYGFNLDHGGVNGGLKVLIEDVPQNQATQGHGQGYLGSLKSLTPELVEDASILNGPFSAQYGDFSGLGVVHIRTKESLPDELTFRLQGGSFNSYRSFLAYSPDLRNTKAFVGYELSRTDGPFLNPLRYKRDNVTANLTRKLDETQSVSFKFNFGRNDFYSSGQIPLDEVAAGRLDRFGFVDPLDGGRVRSGVASAYYRKDFKSGDTFKADGFLSRSLFDLYSNFTFFLVDQNFGDEIQQHDSRLQEGANAQFLHPYKLFGSQSLLIIGGNFHANQINIDLYPTIARNPVRKFITPENLANPDIALTRAHADVTNEAAYVQQAIDLQHGHVHIEAGLRFDYFRFDVKDKVNPAASGVEGAGRWQPKFSVAYNPTDKIPTTFYFNYGRGISSQDARGVVQRPDAPRVSTTDFYQLGASHNLKNFSVVVDAFLIDRSNEQVYIPDDGTFEFKGPSRAYGYELKTSLRFFKYFSFNAGMTQVLNAFYRDRDPLTNERIYVDSAPHNVANGAITLNDWRGFNASLNYRHTSNYRLDGEDATIRASGLDVLDFSLRKTLRRWVDFNFAIDNLTDKRYFETQNYFESRLRPGDEVKARIHGTPGYPFGVSAGLTFKLFKKD